MRAKVNRLHQDSRLVEFDASDLMIDIGNEEDVSRRKEACADVLLEMISAETTVDLRL